jgi:hypothetical protein
MFTFNIVEGYQIAIYLYLISPLIILLAIISIIFIIIRKNKKDSKKISIVKNPIFWLFLLIIVVIPMVYVLCGVYYNIRAQVNRRIIEKIIEKDELENITSEDFIKQFLINPEDTDFFYRNKFVKITGIIEYIGIPKDNAPLKDNSYITFSNSENPDIFDLNPNIIRISFYFTNNEIVRKLKRNKEGEVITIIGKYRSYNFNERSKYIQIGDCEIINNQGRPY